MKKILLTGFQPFGGETVNPSLEAVKLLEGKQLKGGVVTICEVPVVRHKSIETVIRAIETQKPDIVITVGQAGGRTDITPERVAINIDDYRIPDNEANRPIDEPVVAGGPAAYFSTLPVKSMVEAMHNAGIPASLSNSAGTFVCNHLFYGVHHYLAKSTIRHGFVHIPFLPEQVTDVSQPSMTLELIVKGLEVAAQAVLDNDTDSQQSHGTIC
ncbi:pyroglutamyl-peptidase I [Desulforhopalus sp. IMCC35007]|uniref:pyroglutamyl-peptidase I n=1 Tax=Desulforhopalus sp. IMCC35007 TaxID=2569543 RepID=UPI0010AE9286|nr:pyroglutamyl-peptidase I [Desulforhopalus sp. IMCC35007]TKB07192.1 pyroglutamyl-peptidase I [Desulforhopalus sp. IMCC35007]